MIDYLKELEYQSKTYGVTAFTNPVLTDSRFKTWSGAGSDKHHHYGDGGLCKHTYEVWRHCISVVGTYICYNVEPYKAGDINLRELFVSAVWHDYGKIWDYQKDENGVWGKHNNHARHIHHISRSALEWNKFEQSKIYNKTEINVDNVTHNILAHHGMREYGSPVSPATREAWILHLADNLSARLDDCDKHDIIKH